IAFDAGAIAGMVREISSFYGQHSGQRPLSDDPRPFQYIDYAASMERWEASTNGRKHRAYWEESLRGATPIALPVDFSRDDVDARRDAAPLGFAHDPMHVYRHSAASVPSVAKVA